MAGDANVFKLAKERIRRAVVTTELAPGSLTEALRLQTAERHRVNALLSPTRQSHLVRKLPASYAWPEKFTAKVRLLSEL